MARITFLWHLHQPLYRTADHVVHAPWVVLHAAGEYFTLLRTLRETGWRGHVLNLTPVFLDQLAAYRDRTARDPLLQAIATPTRELPREDRRLLVNWARHLHPRQAGRFERLVELVGRTVGEAPDEIDRLYTAQDLNDLAVLLVLAYAAPNLEWEPELAELAARGEDFSDSARNVVAEWLASCPARLLRECTDLARCDGIEIATSPWGHPIVPLLIDTAIVAESRATRALSPPPPLAMPDDAALHIRRGLEYARQMGFSASGCWPPEGALSAAAVRLFGEHGVSWLATDEGILSASLGQPVTGETGFEDALFRPWRLAGEGPSLFFRHRALSDFISFQGSRFHDEAEAAGQFVRDLCQLANRASADAGILVALDGENPWTAYPEGGRRFLKVLADELLRAPRLEPATLAQRARDETHGYLERLHPGSWIGSSFATWIGQEEKNRGWELLDRVRQRIGTPASRSWLAAEGSDWWWWLGDDNPTPLAPLYDALLRAHLADACAEAGLEPPAELTAPLRSSSIPLLVPLSRQWPTPTLDGRSTSYFEWAVAVWVEAPASHRLLGRAALRADGERLFLRVEARGPGTAVDPLVVTVVSERQRTSYTLPRDIPGSCAVGVVLEAALPRPASEALVSLEHRGERLPAEGFWRLRYQEVDEP
jgi:alpha-amylase/alpha-mannosidase (GH57 family)